MTSKAVVFLNIGFIVSKFMLYILVRESFFRMNFLYIEPYKIAKVKSYNQFLSE